MQMWFIVEGFEVNVSTHGYFTIYSPKMPVAKFSSCPSQLCSGGVNELGHGIYYNPDVDDINVDLSETGEPVKEFVKAHLAELRAKEVEALKLWEEIKANRPPITGHGDEVRIGDAAIMVSIENGKESEYKEKVRILYYDGNSLVYEPIEPKPKPGGSWSCRLEGPGWTRKFTKVEV